MSVEFVEYTFLRLKHCFSGFAAMLIDCIKLVQIILNLNYVGLVKWFFCSCCDFFGAPLDISVSDFFSVSHSSISSNLMDLIASNDMS